MLTDKPITIGFALHDLSRSIRHTFDLRARKLGVTRTQWRVLLSLARLEGASQTELADALEVERISVCRMIDRLVENGLVERRADPLDRRVWRLHLLPAAHDIVSQLTAIGQELEGEVLDTIPADQQEEFLGLLMTMRDGVRALRETYEGRKEVA